MLKNAVIPAMIIITAFLNVSNAEQAEPLRLTPPSMFADQRAYMVGDVITILLMEFTSGSNQASTNSNIEHELEVGSEASGTLSFIPGMGLSSSINSDQQSKGATSRQGSLKGKISAQVVEVLANGNLRLKGQRMIEVNGEQQITILSGLVRPRDIRADNSIYSYLIADASISFKGKGDVHNTARPGLFSRFIGWIF